MKLPVLIVISCLVLTACDVGPNGYGTAPAGVSQAQWDAQVASNRSARRQHYAGPRGGASGR